jgi:hypothetical protein
VLGDGVSKDIQYAFLERPLPPLTPESADLGRGPPAALLAHALVLGNLLEPLLLLAPALLEPGVCRRDARLQPSSLRLLVRNDGIQLGELRPRGL